MGKIAVIDSGIGGLTVVKEMMQQLPHEDIVYFGDQKNCPYGDKTKEQIQQYVVDIVDFLQNLDLKALVIACNTATSVVLPQLSERYSFPIIGVIEPGAKFALQATKNKQIAVIGTKKTIQTGAYEQTLKAFDPEVSVYSMSCPKLVPLLEGEGTPEMLHLALEEYLFPFKSKHVDTLVLGCTHYPLVSKQIEQILGEEVVLANPAIQTVRELKEALTAMESMEEATHEGTHLFYTSGNATSFNQKASTILGCKVVSIQEETLFDVSKLS